MLGDRGAQETVSHSYTSLGWWARNQALKDAYGEKQTIQEADQVRQPRLKLTMMA